jgi:hypothetical protein
VVDGGQHGDRLGDVSRGRSGGWAWEGGEEQSKIDDNSRLVYAEKEVVRGRCTGMVCGGR